MVRSTWEILAASATVHGPRRPGDSAGRLAPTPAGRGGV